MAEEKKDKAEYELDLASDCGWIRGLDAAGKPIRISKVDMVELIRANMPIATSERNGLMNSADRHLFPIRTNRSGNYKSMKISSCSKWSRGILLISEASGAGKMGGIGFLFIDGRPERNEVFFTYLTFGSTHSSTEFGDNSTSIYYDKQGDIYTIYAKTIQEASLLDMNIINVVGNSDIVYEECTIPSSSIRIEQKRFAFQ